MRTTFLLSLAFSTTILAKPQYPSRRQQQRLNIAQQQQQLVVPGSGSERAQGGVAGEGAGGGNTSGTSILPVIVHLVDPSSPSSPPSSSSSSDSDSSDSDSPNFGSPCTFTSTFTTCGDYYDETTGIDHGLFCSPTEETCAGLGAACGSSESCDEGLLCNFSTHRCILPSSLPSRKLSSKASRMEQRRKATHSNCPEGSETCPDGIMGGFSCIFTMRDDLECGACLSFGGRNCAQEIPNALATACREGTCFVHACTAGYSPSENNSLCEEDEEDY